ncbi:MAG TPA: 30S ribosomal protein S20 [Deinococcales bacterium]|nr:30S ribosomal protein S20 [Deinococcales bacterium]
MANTKSAKRRIIKSAKAREINRSRKSAIRTFTKKAVNAAEAGDFEAAAKYQRVSQSLIDKAAKGSTLHKNNAARRKARMASRIARLREQAAS